MTPDDTFKYRGRSLEELVPRIREDLGDDAVIVSRRETTSGGVGGFFAKREIEVEVRPGESAPNLAAAFAQQLAQAHERQQQQPAPGEGADLRPVTGAEIDALPSSADVTVDDLFPAPPPSSQGLAALFNAGMAPAAPSHDAEQDHADEPEAAAPAPARSPEIVEDDEWVDEEPEAAAPAPARSPEIVEDDEWVDEEPEAEAPAPARSPEIVEDDEWVDEEPEAEAPEAVEPEPEVEPPAPVVEQPTGVFDYLGVGEAPAPEPVGPAALQPPPAPAPDLADVAAAAPTPEPFAAAVPDPAPAPELVVAAAPPHTGGGLPPAARAAVDHMVSRGLRPGLAEAIAEEAMTGLAPLAPGADAKDLVTEALARRIPMMPLRRGPGVVGFVGPGGAGKTRCVARLAAAHARHGALPVSVVALRSPDGGAELRRLLAPYGVALHAVESGAEGAARIAALRGEGLVIVDTPGVSPRSSGELRALGFELDSLAPDELHLAVPATIGPDAARELVGGVRELGVGALVLTHTDETEILGTVIGLAIDSGLPLSYLARGQAVEAGLRPASAVELAADLVP
jgi:flagellar biosynthesis GTPase FlhF